MKRLILILLVAFVAFVGWRITESISSDALGLAIGVVFGVLAGLPTALLVLASNRRRDHEGNGRRQQPNGQMAYGHQAPVIVLAAPSMHPQQTFADPHAGQGQAATQQAWPQPRERRFQFIGGEQDGGFDG